MTEFSTNASEQLFARFPEWRKYAALEQDAHGETFVRLEVPAPDAANACSGLIVSTSNEEVTVEFDYYHSHFDDMVGDGNDAGTEALTFIQQIIAEEVAAVSWWQDEAWRGSSYINAGETAMPSQFAQPFNRVRIRSWRGSLNADLDA